ncbi:MAG: 4Fe-4S dicluster domain-containing protein [Candidatus Helarchaeota archaeon]
MPVIVDEAKCTGCGICVDICHRLVYELQMKNGRKVAVSSRQEYCLKCFLCVNPCLTKAIRIPWKKEEKEM